MFNEGVNVFNLSYPLPLKPGLLKKDLPLRVGYEIEIMTNWLNFIDVLPFWHVFKCEINQFGIKNRME